MPTFTTYESTAQKESWEDEVFMVSPRQRPFFNALQRRNAIGRLHQWPQDELPVVAGDGRKEGDTAPASETITPLQELQSYTEIITAYPEVSDTQQAIETWGVDNEMDRQAMRYSQGVMNRYETSMLNGQAGAVGDNTATFRTMASAQAQMKANGNTKTVVALAVTSITEDHFLDVSEAIYNNSGEAPNAAFMRPTDKKLAAGWDLSSPTAAPNDRQRFIDANNRTITYNVEVYVDPYGASIMLIPTRNYTDQSFLIANTDYWAEANLRPLAREEQARMGDARREKCVIEGTVACLNQYASGLGDMTG